MKFPVLWSGITHSVLGAPVNSSCYIKKIVNCAIKQSGKVFEYIHIENALYKCITITVEPRLSGPRLSGLFDYPDFFSGPVFFMNINKL